MKSPKESTQIEAQNTSKASNNAASSGRFWGWLLFGFFLVGGAAVWGWWQYEAIQAWKKTTEGSELSQRGQIGDSFGSLNALFGGLGFAGVVFTLYRQSQDGKESDNRHREALDIQERTARLQALASALQFLQWRLGQATEEREELAELENLVFSRVNISEDDTAASFQTQVLRNHPQDGAEILRKFTKHFGTDDGSVAEVTGDIAIAIPHRVSNLHGTEARLSRSLGKVYIEIAKETDLPFLAEEERNVEEILRSFKGER